MKVFVYGFWSGFLEKTDPNNINFFLNLLSKVFNEECKIGSVDDSEILLESVFSSNTYLKYKQWKYTFCFSGESNQRVENFCSKERLETLSMYSCVLCGERNHKNVVNVPLFIPYIHCNNFIEKLENSIKISKVPEKDICIIVSNSKAKDRNFFFEKLEEHFKVDYAGNYKNNIERIKAEYNTKEFQEFVSKYKFIISMDNSKDDTYITEKITHGFLAGNIPIYWGSSYVNNYFNINRFINVENMDDETIQKAIDKIKLLMNNKDEYLKMVNQNIFPNNNNKISRTLEEIAKDIQNTIFKKAFPLINKIYVITSSIFEPDRYNHILNIFNNKLNTNIHNIEFHCPTYKTTINKKFLKDKINENSIEQVFNSSRKKAEISLFYNHYSVLKHIKNNYKDGYFLICESDVIPNKNIDIFNDFLFFLNNNKEKWDIINIGTPYTYMMFDNFFLEDFTNESNKYRLIKKKQTRCTDSFIFSYSGIIKYLNIIDNDLNYELPYDHYMNYILEKYSNDIKMYWSIPSFFDQGSFNGMKTKMD
jgi:hypothetical protein